MTPDTVAPPRLKIAYLSGPANTREIYGEWSAKTQQAYFGTDYMKQFLQLAHDVGASAYVVSWFGEKSERFQVGEFTFDNRPITTASGLRYHLEQFVWHMKVLAKLIAYRPDVVLLTGNQNHWWLLSPIRLWAAKIIISYHAVVWPKLPTPKRSLWHLVKLNAALILRHAKAILVTSNDIRRQVEQLLGANAGHADIVNHLPTYSRQQFAGIQAPGQPSARPFRILFLGRMVENKGIFDIVDMARQLELQHRGMYRFDLCGSGPDLERARAVIRELGLEDVAVCHGFCAQPEIRALLDASHACIVPTRSDFEAGFEMTCAEAILAGRPLITSKVCPALEYLGGASVEATPDDPDSYREAIVRLSTDADLYERKRKACAGLQEQFYDPANSWYTAMKRVFDRHILPHSKGSAVGSVRHNEIAQIGA